MKKTVLIFSVLIFCLILLFQVGKFAILKGSLDTEILIALIAIVFFFVGVVLNKKSFQLNHKYLENNIDYKKIKELKISNREYEVLLELSEGSTNKDIADKLFISESTTKTHVSNLMSKLQVSKRFEAVKKQVHYK